MAAEELFTSWLDDRLESSGHADYILSLLDGDYGNDDHLRRFLVAVGEESGKTLERMDLDQLIMEIKQEWNVALQRQAEGEILSPKAGETDDIFGPSLQVASGGLSASAQEFCPGSGLSSTPPVAAAAIPEGEGGGEEEEELYFGEGGGISGGDPGFDWDAMAAYQEQQGAYIVTGAGEELFMDGYEQQPPPFLLEEGGAPAFPESPFMMEEELHGHLLDILTSSFPDCSLESIDTALTRGGWDVDLASNMLRGALTRSSDRNMKPCRHYLNGECLRRDCTFSHDFESTICRYWLQSICRNGDTCAFVHDIDLSDGALDGADDEDGDDDEQEEREGLNLLDPSEEFPALGAAASSASSTSGDDRQHNSMSFAAVAADRSSEWAREDRGPVTSTAAKRVVRMKGLVPWVTSGKDVSHMYQQARTEASDLARQRNKCFMAATSAYRKGDRRSLALARNLAIEGRALNDKMKEKHREAARGIFDMRNSWQNLVKNQMLDLHGLHIAEAWGLLADLIPALHQAGLRRVCIITGSGHHSKGSNFRARLLPSVERFCQEWGLPYELLADKHGHIGMLRVSIVAGYPPEEEELAPEPAQPRGIVIR